MRTRGVEGGALYVLCFFFVRPWKGAFYAWEADLTCLGLEVICLGLI